MDMKATFLNGNLYEDVFTSKDGSEVCKLQKSIYGLKQASRSWNIRFNETIKEFGFSQKSSLLLERGEKSTSLQSKP